MPKYRTKKPVEVEAIQFDPSGPHKDELPELIKGVAPYGVDNWNYYGCKFFGITSAGYVEVFPGDWIVSYEDIGVQLWRPEEFEEIFEKVEEE